MRSLLATLIATMAVTTVLPASVSAQYYRAVLDGSQETPPNASPGHGIGCFYLDDDGMLYYEVSFYGLWAFESRSHIHGPAAPGVSWSPLYLLDKGNPKFGVLGPLTPAQIGYLNDSLCYVNIHTPVVPHGEIRGQIVPADWTCTVPVRNTTWGGIKALYR